MCQLSTGQCAWLEEAKGQRMEASNQDSLRVQDREQPWLGFQAGEGSRGQSGRRGPQT